jgi:signal transduction histidine kinase
MSPRDKTDREDIAELVLALAHDCSNLLAVAQLSLRSAGRALDRGAPAHANLQIVREIIDRMGVMMQRIRALSRGHDLVPELLSLNDLARYVCSILGPVFGEQARLTLRLDPALPLIEADRLEMEQVLMNLLLNARAASAPGGQIGVETCTVVIDKASASTTRRPATGVYARLTVIDTGRGMTEAALAHVFEPFFTTKAAEEGTGLGLAGSRRIVERCGGCIFIHSDTNRGTRVEVLLPARSAGALVGSRATGHRRRPAVASASMKRVARS